MLFLEKITSELLYFFLKMSIGVMELEVRFVFACGMCQEGNTQENLIKSGYRGFSVDLPLAKEVSQIHLFS